MKPQEIKKIAFSVCILLTIGFAALAIYNYKEYLETDQNYQNQKVKLNETLDEIEEIKELLERYDQEKEEFSQYLFEERDIPGFLDTISQYAKEADINVVDMKTKRFQKVVLPDTVEKKNQYMAKKKSSVEEKQEEQERMKRIWTLAAMPIDVEIDGAFDAIGNFFSKLEENKQLINVSNLEINRNKKYPELESQFTIKIYSLKTLEDLQNNEK
ncbi:MAG: type 4a pilus biogenesis protein PilO [Candidatus Omnitrophica bacterium]|nr:type 4a pilus biogenesis protein PilO [Candidatus Omnitrophota bacterium]